jgi:hypothetical protein
MANVVVFSRMDEGLKRALEAQAKRERRSPSNLLVSAAEFYLRRHGPVAAPDALAAAAAAPACAAPGQAAASATPVARRSAALAGEPARKSPRPKAKPPSQ